MSKRVPFDVYLHGKWIDRVFYYTPVSTDECRKDLVEHDGMDAAIVVKRGAVSAKGLPQNPPQTIPE